MPLPNTPGHIYGHLLLPPPPPQSLLAYDDNIFYFRKYASVEEYLRAALSSTVQVEIQGNVDCFLGA